MLVSAILHHFPPPLTLSTPLSSPLHFPTTPLPSTPLPTTPLPSHPLHFPPLPPSQDSSQPTLLALRDDILLQNAHDLQFCCTLSPHVARYVLHRHPSPSILSLSMCFPSPHTISPPLPLSPSSLLSCSISRLLTETIASDSMSMIQKCFECSASELPQLVAQSPVRLSFSFLSQCSSQRISVFFLVN